MGTLYMYSNSTPGCILSSTLSLFPVGEIQSPWVCKLVVLKQWGVLIVPLPFVTAAQSGWGGRLLLSPKRIVYPGLISTVGATKSGLSRLPGAGFRP